MRPIAISTPVRPGPRRPSRRGFTLLEMLFGLGVIFLLMGLLIAGISLAGRGAKGAVDLATVNSLKMGVDQFTQQMGFAPPLVNDGYDDNGQPLVNTGGRDQPRVYQPVVSADADFLRTINVTQADYRFSYYSLPYYVLGVLEAPIDGVAGPGFAEPNRDGTFKVKGTGSNTKPAGRRFEPFFDVSRNADAVVAVNAQEGRYELRDRAGVPIRYYRWLPDAGPMPSNIDDYLGTGDPTEARGLRAYLNTPFMVGDPATDPKLRDATWAIVAAGADGLFGNEHEMTSTPYYIPASEMMERLGVSDPDEIFSAASADNIVVVGK